MTQPPDPNLDLEPSEVPPAFTPVPELRRAAIRPADHGRESAEIHLTNYIKVLYKRRWLGLTVFLSVVVSVAVYSFTAVPIYEAKSRLLIESDQQNVVNFKQVVQEDQTKIDYYQTQYNILQSRALARKTLDSLKLWGAPPFGGGGGKRAFSLTSALMSIPSAIVGVFSKEEAPVTVPGADETAAQSRAIDAFLGGLIVSPIRTSRLVDIKYRSTDPALATAIINSLARSYIEQNLEYRFTASKDATDWLGGQLETQRKEVERAETALQRYREQNDAVAIEDRNNIVDQKLGDLNAAVTRAKMERIQKEGLYSQLRDSQANPTVIDTFPAIMVNSFVQQLKGELADLQRRQAQMADRIGDKHPDMLKVKSEIQVTQTKLNGEIAKIVQSVKAEYQAALAQEQSLTQALNQQKNEALSRDRKAIEFNVLLRDMQSSKQIYDSLLQRTKEAGISGELKTSNIRVVDIAERPESPISPRRDFNMMLALFVGSALACGVVFLFEYMDSRIKTPDEIRTYFDLSCLGLLPKVDDKADGAYPLLSETVPAGYSEAFRSVRTNVLFSAAHEKSRSLVITSTGPGEGKSSVVCNLAVSLAQAGQRVLLIDADMRKPKVHTVMSISQEPGLSNVLVGSSKASESVRKSTVSGLWVLPAGRVPPNPAELIASGRFRDFLASLRVHFDWVLIDSPPIMAVTDAALVAHNATGVLFVVGAEMTSRHAMKRALDQLGNVNANVIGAVLNRVDLQRHAYYYSSYYRREYSSYYSQPNN